MMIYIRGGYRPGIYITTDHKHIILGLWRDALFSERHSQYWDGTMWCKRIGPFRLTVRQKRNP